MNPITFNYTGAIQNYTVPITGTYDLSGFGAGGGAQTLQGTHAGGSGAEIGGTFNLTAGQQLEIIVGGQGIGTSGNNGAGGGGFTEILVNSGANGAYVPLLIAGGGGGGSVFNAGGNASVANPGTLGLGGAAGASSNTNSNVAGGGGGAGATSNGGTATTFGNAAGGQGGFDAANGAGGGTGGAGATGVGNSAAAPGGYGGGGGGGGATFGSAGGGGGGGGSTGGTGGSGTSNGTSTGGGGGTSYISNTGVQNFQETMSGAGVSTGNGSVRILAPVQPVQPAVPCYVTGTRIRVLRGRTIRDEPVERLRVGDLALTVSGKPHPIRWIGSRSYAGLTAPQADRPVRIKAGALADGMPARDLLVSPDHCLWLDGLLVAAGHLVNGTSITRGEAVRDLTYWHVELDTHDLLLAESTPAESFLAAPGVRAGFDGVGEETDAGAASVPYAPRVETDPNLTALRERLILRASLSIEPTRFGAVRAWMDRCDGIHVAGWAQDAAYPNAPVCLDIVVDGVVVAMTLAEQYRADIAAAGVGDGCHGFEIDLDAPLAPGMRHIVEVRRSADGLRICAMAVDAAGAWTALLAA